MNTLIAKIKSFYSSYKLLLIPIIPIVFFFFLFFFIFSPQKKQPTPPPIQRNNPEISQAPAQAIISPEEHNPYSLAEEQQDIAFKKIKLDTEKMAEESISQETLSDGSIKYKYSSADPNRPHMQIVKDSIPVFRRNLVSQTTISAYSDYLKTPEYTEQGSAYYGSTATIFASPTKGIAIVANSQTKQVYEQYLFQALSVDNYIQKYGRDISTY